MSANARKPSQRERLVDAMTHVSVREGYADMSIAHLTSEAGVSRQTFYECFEDKEDCFLAAYEQASTRILGRLSRAIETGDWWETPPRAARALLGELEADPEAAWLLLIEGMAGGARTREHRRKLLIALEAGVRDFLKRAPSDAPALDIPPIALVGAVRGIASAYLSTTAADRLPGVLDDLVTWIRSYSVPAGQPLWSSTEHLFAMPSPDDLEDSAPLLPRPEPLPRGRHSLPPSIVARNHRERITYATAEVALSKGYVEMTVGDIVALAGVGRDVFYEHFLDKQRAFLAAQRHGTKDLFNACARAYFSGKTWPQRIWNGLRALTYLTAKEPALAHLRLIEPYAAGPEAIQRMQETTANFAVFLSEGFQYRPQARQLPDLCSDAIAGAVFEVIRREVDSGHTTELPRHLPELAYTALAPFTGPSEAAQLVEELSARSTAPRRA